MITQAALHEWLSYDPETGIFRWRKSRRGYRTGGGRGDIAGSVENGRRKLCLNRKRIAAARAAYIYVHGDIPPAALIDHKDGDTLNDRIANLRLASAAQNIWNSTHRAGARYALGVSKNAKGRFKARIQCPDGRKMNLGTWATEAEAHAAYMGAAAILHSEFWIGLRSAQNVEHTA